MSPRHLTALAAAAILFAVAVAAAPADDTTTTDTTTTTTTVTTVTTTDPPPETTTTVTTTSVPTPPPSTTQAPAPPTSKPPPPPSAPKTSARTTKSSHPEPAREPHARPHHEKRRHRRISKPLRVTPPLGQTGYVFPVAGAAAYGDTYGAFRGDVHGKWHHGTDIFAALGTPVVAVASGTVNRVGWRRAGGWRVWVRDGAANEFYYAHLSGYARPIFHSRYVRAGQVIGFVGNTGDAFPGPPHLHFEIHPHQLLRLHYDGAVNPSSYLEGWSRLQRVEAPRPKHPALTMKAEKRRQAEVVFRRLLVARELVAPARSTDERTPVDVSPQRARRVAEVNATAARAASTGGSSPPLLAPLLMGAVSVAVFTALVLLVRLGRRVRAPSGG